MMLVTPPQIQPVNAAADPIFRQQGSPADSATGSCKSGIKNAVSEYGISFAGALSL
ncbi:MAG: hypothetical protein WB445_08200 [Acinetobacter sp.]